MCSHTGTLQCYSTEDISAEGVETTCEAPAGKEPADGSSCLLESCEGTAFQQEVKSTEQGSGQKEVFKVSWNVHVCVY